VESAQDADIIKLEARMVTLTAENLQVVVGEKGQPTGVLIDIRTWEQILDALEDAEDVELARQALAELDAVGGDLEKAGYTPWHKARAELEKMDAQK
jgi:PHD/YefM family antitoxin component YafN of YafNO toxin-antitoxin module